jgi:hypothetical protein
MMAKRPRENGPYFFFASIILSEVGKVAVSNIIEKGERQLNQKTAMDSFTRGCEC